MMVYIHTTDMPRYDAGNKKGTIKKLHELTIEDEIKDIKRQLYEIKHTLVCERQLREFGEIDFRRNEEPGVVFIHTENIPKYMELNRKRELRQQEKKES